MILADGLAVASFVVNIFIAAGTLAAACVALYLGLSARRDQHERDEREGAAERRQIAAVLTLTEPRHRGDDWATIEIINASSDLITDVLVAMQAIGATTGAPRSDPGWHWTTKPPSFLAAGTTFTARGSFHTLRPDGSLDQSTFVSPSQWDTSILLAWHDAHGDYWARLNGADPYLSSPSMPIRHLADFLHVPSRRERLARALSLPRLWRRLTGADRRAHRSAVSAACAAQAEVEALQGGPE